MERPSGRPEQGELSRQMSCRSLSRIKEDAAGVVLLSAGQLLAMGTMMNASTSSRLALDVGDIPGGEQPDPVPRGFRPETLEDRIGSART